MKLNRTCTCDSPLVSFTGSWKAEEFNISSSHPAPSSVRMVSRANGDIASFNFTGTAIWVYPATDQPHGGYDVYLDGTLSRFNASNSSSTTVPLFQTMGLPCTPHVLSIHNTGTNVTTDPSYLDLATIIWEERDQFGNATSMLPWEDEDSSGFGWYPFDEWTVQSQTLLQDSASGASNVTVDLHVTDASDAQMEYNFTANSISIYGKVGPFQGPYSASLHYAVGTNDNDNLPNELLLNASFPFNRTGVLLFYASNINQTKSATLTIRNRPDKQGDSLSIHHASLVRYGTHHNYAPHKGLTIGAMVGAILGPIAVIVLLASGIYLLQRRRQAMLIRQQKTNIFKDSLSKRGVLPDSNSPTKAAIDEEPLPELLK